MFNEQTKNIILCFVKIAVINLFLTTFIIEGK